MQRYTNIYTGTQTQRKGQIQKELQRQRERKAGKRERERDSHCGKEHILEGEMQVRRIRH